jgi:hypothetical protein
MKIKIVGFKVGKSRPTANRTFDSARIQPRDWDDELGGAVWKVLAKSDFISIRRVSD